MSITESIDDSIWNAIRGIEESMMLLNHMGDHYAEDNQTHIAAKYFQKATEASERLEMLKNVLKASETLTADRVESEEPER
jgi:two-component system chemotaxis response regulator CheB